MVLISVNIENLFDSVEYGFTKYNRMKLVAEVVVVTDYYKFNILFTKLPPPLQKKLTNHGWKTISTFRNCKPNIKWTSNWCPFVLKIRFNSNFQRSKFPEILYGSVFHLCIRNREISRWMPKFSIYLFCKSNVAILSEWRWYLSIYEHSQYMIHVSFIR